MFNRLHANLIVNERVISLTKRLDRLSKAITSNGSKPPAELKEQEARLRDLISKQVYIEPILKFQIDQKLRNKVKRSNLMLSSPKLKQYWRSMRLKSEIYIDLYRHAHLAVYALGLM